MNQSFTIRHPERLPEIENLVRKYADLQPMSELNKVAASFLARHGTESFNRVMYSGEPLGVTLSGKDAIVAISKDQYNEIISLIKTMREEIIDSDPFSIDVEARFDALVSSMEQPGYDQAAEAALFASPETLRENYAPGLTETKETKEPKS